MNYSKIRSMQGFWILGKIVDHTAFPLDAEDIDRVVEQLARLSAIEARCGGYEEEIKRSDMLIQAAVELDRAMRAYNDSGKHSSKWGRYMTALSNISPSVRTYVGK